MPPGLHRKAKRLGERLLEAAGYNLVPTWRAYRFPQEKYLRRLLAFAQVGCVLDVGANNGQFYEFLRSEVGFKGLIVSFEPIPELATSLRERARADPGWIVEGCALGATAGDLELCITRDSQFSSFLQPDDVAAKFFQSETEITERVIVPVRTLNEVISEYRSTLQGLNLYLKIDAQGYDLQVLDGASDVMGAILGLQVEASVRPIYENAPTYQTLLSALSALGFEMSAIFPNNPGHFPLLIEFDCHLIARSVASLGMTSAR